MGGIGEKAGARDGGNSNRFNQMTGHLYVIRHWEGGNVGHYVVSPARMERTEAGSGKSGEHVVAALLVVAG